LHNRDVLIRVASVKQKLLQVRTSSPLDSLKKPHKGVVVFWAVNYILTLAAS